MVRGLARHRPRARPRRGRARIELPCDREADLVVTGDRNTVLGATAAEHDLAGARRAPAALAWRARRAACAVPLVAPAQRRIPRAGPGRRPTRLRNFDIFDFALNGVATRGDMAGQARVVIVICDSLRADLIGAEDSPFLVELAGRGAHLPAHRSVFPSTTRVEFGLDRDRLHAGAARALRQHRWRSTKAKGWSAAPPARPISATACAAPPAAPCMCRRLAERLRWHGESAITCANVSPGAAYFQDPDGHGYRLSLGWQLRAGQRRRSTTPPAPA